MQAGGRSLGEPARGSHQSPAVQVVWSCWESGSTLLRSGHPATPTWVGFPFLSFSLCILYANKQFRAGCSRGSGHPSLPSKAWDIPRRRSRSAPLGISAMTQGQGKVESQGGRLITYSLFSLQAQLSLHQFPPHHVKYNPGSLGCVAKPLEISLLLP